MEGIIPDFKNVKVLIVNYLALKYEKGHIPVR